VNRKTRESYSLGAVQSTDALWVRIRALVAALRGRGEEDLARYVEGAVRSNTGLTDGWELMLDGLVAARSFGEKRFADEERADLDEIIAAVQKALKR